MSSRKCPQCGLVNWSSAEACKRCGLNFAEAEADHYAPQPEGAYAYAQPYPPAGNDYQRSYGYYPPPSTDAKSSGLAIASLVLGVISFFTLGLFGVGAIAGLVMGIVAMRRIRRNPSLYGGEGFAVAGIVMGCISVLTFGFVAMIAAIAIPNLLASRRAANEAMMINKLRQISSAQATYASTAGFGKYGTLEQLVESGLLDKSLSRGGPLYGYRLEIRVSGNSFEAVATPVSYGQSTSPGRRSFYVSSDGVIRGADKKGLEANINDPPLVPEVNPYARPTRRAYSDSYPVQSY